MLLNNMIYGLIFLAGSDETQKRRDNECHSKI